MSAYYNENEPYAAAWLRNLIAEGLIARGDVDERSIEDVRASDFAGYTQCHFFAGIGGGSYALRLAGWPDDQHVWTGSCPCQPFSIAGKKQGFADKRHLWPAWRGLIAECHPPTVFGEQVAGAPAWLALVRGDLEALDYAVGCVPVEATSAGADHFRDRYWFVADRDGERLQVAKRQPSNFGTERAPFAGDSVRLLVDTAGDGWGEGWAEDELRRGRFAASSTSCGGRQYIECPDGKWRRLPPPRVRWLGNGVSARVAKLRAFGNAIDPRPAAQFVGAFMDTVASAELI